MTATSAQLFQGLLGFPLVKQNLHRRRAHILGTIQEMQSATGEALEYLNASLDEDFEAISALRRCEIMLEARICDILRKFSREG